MADDPATALRSALPAAGPSSSWRAEAVRLWPGVMLCAVIGLAATTIARPYGGPQLLYTLLIGMALHTLGAQTRAEPGIECCARFVLRVGVALLGARITAAQIGALGWPTVLLVLGAVGITIAAGLALARGLRLPATMGLLAGVATAICGASAALAVAAVLPRSRALERSTLLVVIGVTSLSTLAMVVYPLLAAHFGLGPTAAGVFIGATIHDVAQVVGAGYLIGPAAGDAAVIVKLFRVALLVPVVLLVTVSLRRRCTEAAAGTGPWLPWFLKLFIVLVVLNSLELIPQAAQPLMQDGSRACLVLAIAALGLKAAPRSLLDEGWRPLLLLGLVTLLLMSGVLAFVSRIAV